MEAIYSVSADKTDLLLYLLDGDTVVSQTIVDLTVSDIPLPVLTDYYTSLKGHLVEKCASISENSLDSELTDLYNVFYVVLPKIHNLTSLINKKELEQPQEVQTITREEIVIAGEAPAV